MGTDRVVTRVWRDWDVCLLDQIKLYGMKRRRTDFETAVACAIK